MNFNQYNPYGYQPSFQNYQQQLQNLQNLQNQAQQLQQNYKQHQQQQQTQPQMNVFAYVNGIEGAKAYPVAPATTIILFDSDNAVFYKKTADINGKATLEAYEYKNASTKKEEPKIDTDNFVTKKDFESLKKKFDTLQKEIKKGG